MRHRGKHKIKSVKTTVQEYAGASTAHGITYIFEKDRWGIERVFWILMVVFALVGRYGKLQRILNVGTF